MTQNPAPPTGPTGPIVSLPELPGATAGLVLGILSIVLSMPLVGVILGFLGLHKSRQAKQMAALNPGVYSNEGIAQAGFVCSIVGLIFGAFSTLCGCGWLLIAGFALLAGAAGAAGAAG